MLFLVHCCQSSFPRWAHSPPRLPRRPFHTVLISGPAAWAAQILIWSHCVCSCLQCPQLSELVRFLLWELSVSFHIFHRHRVCIVDRVDLIWSLYSWWEGFRSSSLATLLLGFNCGFISTSSCGSKRGLLGFVPEAALEDLGLPLWGPGVEVMQLLGSQGFWQHWVLRGVGG